MRHKIYILISFILISTKAMADIKEINSINEAKPYLEEANQDTLVIFDVDYTLTQPTNLALQMKNINRYKEVWKETIGGLSRLEEDILSTLVAIDGSSLLVESSIMPLIQNLNKRHAKVIALTGILTGPLDRVPNLEAWRYETLKKHGINFSDSFPKISQITFSAFPLYRLHYPRFKKGILFSNGDASKEAKGKVLKVFLDFIKEHSNWTPKLIIFIDDREYNLKDVENLCSNFHPPIQFVGVLYKGAKNFNSQEISEQVFNEKWKELVQKAKKFGRIS